MAKQTPKEFSPMPKLRLRRAFMRNCPVCKSKKVMERTLTIIQTRTRCFCPICNSFLGYSDGMKFLEYVSFFSLGLCLIPWAKAIWGIPLDSFTGPTVSATAGVVSKIIITVLFAFFVPMSPLNIAEEQKAFEEEQRQKQHHDNE